MDQNECRINAAGQGQAQTPLVLGVSACLLGHPVRYDGGHKRDSYLMDVLGGLVRFVPVCPETECGLGVPREAMRLAGDPGNPRLVTHHTAIDHTERMTAWAKKKVLELERENLCGFVFKSRSPSSGMARVKVYQPDGRISSTGVGLFAKRFMEHFPLLPVEEEVRLRDPGLRENFLERVWIFKRWRDTMGCQSPFPLNWP